MARDADSKSVVASLFFTILLVIAVVLSVMSYIKTRENTQNYNDLNKQVTELTREVQDLKVPDDQSSSGAGVGPNVNTPESNPPVGDTGNTMPNGGGQ